MTVNLSSSEDIFDDTLEYAISACLQNGESEEAMLKKFNGNKVELVKFLRNRRYKEWIKSNKKPADTSAIQKKIDDLIKQHKEDVVEGRLKLYDTDPRSRARVDGDAPPPPEPESDTKPPVKYVEPPALKKKWAKTKEKPKSGKSQSSLF